MYIDFELYDAGFEKWNYMIRYRFRHIKYIGFVYYQIGQKIHILKW